MILIVSWLIIREIIMIVMMHGSKDYHKDDGDINDDQNCG